MLTNLHPYSRGLPYRGKPDYIEFGGTSFRAFYAGFTDCSGECPKNYEPLFVSGWTVCCQGTECLIVSIIQGSLLKPKIKSEPVILFYGLDVNLTASLEWLGDECTNRYQVSLIDYQSFFDTDDLRSLEGFELQQTTFYDFQNVCLCNQVECPPGMTWSQEECACISNPEECLDKRILNLKLALVIPTITLIRVNVNIKNRKTGVITKTPFDLGLDIGISELLIPIAEYRASGNFLFDAISEITEEVVSIALDGLLTYAAIQVAGPFGQRLTEFISVGVDTTVTNYEIVDGECECVPPEGGCSPGTAWSLDECKCVDIPPPPEPESITASPNNEPEISPYQTNSPDLQCNIGQCAVDYRIIASFRLTFPNSPRLIACGKPAEWQAPQVINRNIVVRGPIYSFPHECQVRAIDEWGCSSTFRVGALTGTGFVNFLFEYSRNNAPAFSCDPSFEGRICDRPQPVITLLSHTITRVDGAFDCCGPVPTTSRTCTTGTVPNNNYGIWDIVIALRGRRLAVPTLYRVISVPGPANGDPQVEFDLEATPPTWGVTFNTGEAVFLNFSPSAFVFYEAEVVSRRFRPI